MDAPCLRSVRIRISSLVGTRRHRGPVGRLLARSSYLGRFGRRLIHVFGSRIVRFQVCPLGRFVDGGRLAEWLMACRRLCGRGIRFDAKGGIFAILANEAEINLVRSGSKADIGVLEVLHPVRRFSAGEVR